MIDRELIALVVEDWNRCAEGNGLVTVEELTYKRRHNIMTMFGRADGLDRFRKALDQIKASSYLRGKVKDWQVSFDWLLNPDNFVKVLEGQYVDRDAASNTSTECKIDLPETVLNRLRRAGITEDQLRTRFDGVHYDGESGQLIVKSVFMRDYLIQNHERQLDIAFGALPEIVVQAAA